MLAAITDHINNLKSSPTLNDSPKPPDPTTLVPYDRRSPPFYGGQYTQIGGMWNLKHEIRSPKFYKLLIKTELKGDTALDLKKLYNHIKMCINTATRIIEDLLPSYRYINIH